ncbi:MAG: hypothetical protein H6522_05555 [Mycolicibacterium sp.]|nr:hypothetical protein [Mycolicibacterium sp.]
MIALSEANETRASVMNVIESVQKNAPLMAATRRRPRRPHRLRATRSSGGGADRAGGQGRRPRDNVVPRTRAVAGQVADARQDAAAHERADLSCAGDDAVMPDRRRMASGSGTSVPTRRRRAVVPSINRIGSSMRPSHRGCATGRRIELTPRCWLVAAASQ